VTNYIIRRLALIIVVVLGITLILFAIMYMVPADPAKAAAGLYAGEEQVQKVREEMGLDKPPVVQYLTYLSNLLHGDLGFSVFTRKPVLAELKIYLPATLELASAAMLLNVVIGFSLGILSAARPGRLVDGLSRLAAAVGVGVPVFVVGLLGQLVFYAKLQWLPIGGRLEFMTVPPPQVTGFYTIDALLLRDMSLFKEALMHLIMPGVVLALPQVAYISRLTRSSILEVMGLEYVRVARSKGLTERLVLWRHVMKNAMLVPLTQLGMQIGWMLGGTLLVEVVFSWSGLGYLAYRGVTQHDFVVVMGVTLTTCLMFVFSNLAVDLLYSLLDPRIRY
jgi:peptide/nickel transport system permease protein